MESTDITLEPVDDPDLFGPCLCCSRVKWSAPPLPLLRRRIVGRDEGAGVVGDGCRTAVEDRHPTLQLRPAPPRRRGWGRMGSATCQYDLLSYALNFDGGHGREPQGELHELLRLLSQVRRPSRVGQVVRGPGWPRGAVPAAFSSVTTAAYEEFLETVTQ
ncbi:hypothetical protein OPV22_026510 [Ensete ventricosum]|uniref:Uncharacterized protein n=1 Tax=Ensete ventricosum TaxID=4639 RepID=A0AAV8QI93_ENSVE|nr:hypothetical protein OPV22_026510 [Ensete ventricosum]